MCITLFITCENVPFRDLTDVVLSSVSTTTTSSAASEQFFVLT